MNQVAANPMTFAYALQLQRTTDPDDVWIRFLDGEFTSSKSARRGVGWFKMQTDDLRAAGFPFDDDGGKIQSIRVEYSTIAFPIEVKMVMVTFPDLLDLTQTVTTTYDYGAQSNGQGAMKFTVTGNLDPTTPALETLSVTSRWLPSGEGSAKAMITLGDGVGATETQCWNSDFTPSFTEKPWGQTPDSPDVSGGDESLCPQFPEF